MVLSSRPLIGIPANVVRHRGMDFHVVGEKYMRAVMLLAEATPLPLPVGPVAPDLPSLLEKLDGFLFPGSPSNVAPELYGAPPAGPEVLGDAKRDATALPLIRLAIERKLPLFCICRGMQELNVALGGTLHGQLAKVPGRFDHRENSEAPLEEAYGPRHPVDFTEGGLIHRISGRRTAIVNSLHEQGVDRLAGGLRVEALASDSTIEAVSLDKDDENFVLGVQWHAEWKAEENELSRRLFTAFGKAAAARARR
jgi:putative glutamine amidotransferase